MKKIEFLKKLYLKKVHDELNILLFIILHFKMRKLPNYHHRLRYLFNLNIFLQNLKPNWELVIHQIWKTRISLEQVNTLLPTLEQMKHSSSQFLRKRPSLDRPTFVYILGMQMKSYVRKQNDNLLNILHSVSLQDMIWVLGVRCP